MQIRPFYTYYVAHVIRQYFAELQPTNPTKAYTHNLDCAGRVIRSLSETDRDILKDLYHDLKGMPMNAKVEVAAAQRQMDKSKVWNLVFETERRIAQERELI